MNAASSSLAILATLALATAGCTVQSNDPPSEVYTTGPATSSTPTPDAGSPNLTPRATATVDVGTAPKATAGAGAGVFIGYRGAGQWDVQWTCDTNTSGDACVFDVVIGGTSINAVTELPTDALTTQSSTLLVAHTVTGATLEGLSFSASIGAPIVVSVLLNGAPDPALVFHVTDGSIATATDDPVQYTPASD